MVKMDKKQDKISLVVIIISIIVITVTLSYGFLLTDIPAITNNPANVTATTEKLRLTYIDCTEPSVEDCGDISASLGLNESITKNFQVKNEATSSLNFSLYFKELQNTFEDDELVYKVENVDTGDILVDTTPVPYHETKTNGVLIKENIAIAADTTVNYKITLTFLKKDENQNKNLDANYLVKLSIAAPKK